MSDESALDALIQSNDERRAQQAQDRDSGRDAGGKLADQVSARRKGESDAEADKRRADTAERDRLERLGVKFSHDG